MVLTAAPAPRSLSRTPWCLATLLGGASHKLLELAARPVSESSTIPSTIFGGVLLTKVHLATSVWFLATALGGDHVVREY
ncbi:MAG: hypothetical protein AAF601_02480 [Pseudomonadota bacterium]